MKKRRVSLSTTHIIMLSFLITVLVGGVLLSLPISSADGEAVPFIDALFTSATATCVTGLVVVPTATSWSIFGQIIILLLIQIGGLGVITVMAGLAIFVHKKIGLADRMLIRDAFNLDTLSGLVKFVKKVILGTAAVEGVGALLYMTVFVPKFGAKGIWISVFNSVSAFCNAGIDVIGENSLCDYATNPTVNIVTCALIFLGGIGYIVWWDVVRVLGVRRHSKIKLWQSLTLHSKIALTSSLVLLLGGAVMFFVFEYDNPLTVGGQTLSDKIWVSVFQSFTTRTAGFATVPQENLTNASAVVSLILMFIGGSPVGTAGGVKTVTFAVLMASAISTVKNKDRVSIFGRSLTKEAVSRSVAVCGISFAIMFISTVLLCAVTDANVLDIMYETVSATATVGLTRGLTTELNTVGKIVIIATMYLGRIGPISLAVAFNLKKDEKNNVKDPTEEISVG